MCCCVVGGKEARTDCVMRVVTSGVSWMRWSFACWRAADVCGSGIRQMSHTQGPAQHWKVSVKTQGRKIGTLRMFSKFSVLLEVCAATQA